MHQHYIEDKDSFVPVEDVVETFRKHFGQQKDVAILIGRLVSSTFKGVKKERIRQKGNWSQRLHVYKGMATRSCVLIPANLQSISKYIPEDFFLIRSSSTSAVYGRDTSLICNGFKVLMEVMIHEDGSIQISVGNKIKTLKDLDKIDLNSLKVNSFFCLLKSFRFCEGVDAKLTSKENKENIILQTNAHHNCTAYSPQCIKVLPLNSKRETSHVITVKVCDTRILMNCP